MTHSFWEFAKLFVRFKLLPSVQYARSSLRACSFLFLWQWPPGSTCCSSGWGIARPIRHKVLALVIIFSGMAPAVVLPGPAGWVQVGPLCAGPAQYSAAAAGGPFRPPTGRGKHWRRRQLLPLRGVRRPVFTHLAETKYVLSAVGRQPPAGAVLEH